MVFYSQNPEINVPQGQTLWSWLFESTDRPDRPAGFTDVITKQHISDQDLKSYTSYISTVLSTDYGLQQGDVVVIFSKNSIWYPVATLATIRIGAIACGVSPEYNAEELLFSLRVSKAKFILTEIQSLDHVCAAAESCQIPSRNVMLMGGKRAGMTSLEDLLSRGKARADSLVLPYKIPQNMTNRDVCACLCFSSGTTGLPKAVMISHANIIAQCLQIQQITPPDHNKILAALPFYHITGIVHQLHLPIALKAQVYILSKFTLDSLLRTVADNKIKELLIVPPILIRLVREDSIVSKYDLSHVTRFSSGAAPLSREILDLLEKKFPNTGFKQGYGMSESCSAITSHPPDKYAYKYADKVGMLVASTQVKIVDPDTGRECGVGEAGEIWAKGPQIAMGYLDNPRSTAETFDTDGFLHTGDIGEFDSEGLLSITDRMKEMIKVKGIGVAPAELENVLLGHPIVHDVAICGIPDDRAGERPKAYVVLKESCELSPRDAGHELIRFVKSMKARHKWLAVVEIVNQIPKSPSGKILRRKLRQAFDGAGNTVVHNPEFVAKL